jgi:hypothetical protein
VIQDAFGTEWAAYSKIHGFARKTRESFEMGFGNRIWERLYKMREQRDAEAAARAKASDSKDLVLVRDHLVEEEFAMTGIRLVSGRKMVAHNRGAYGAGAEAGSRVNIHVPVNGDSRSLLG